MKIVRFVFPTAALCVLFARVGDEGVPVTTSSAYDSVPDPCQRTYQSRLQRRGS